MERRSIPDTETRLLLLYALNRLGPVTALQLLQFFVQADLMNYFEMQLNLSELLDQRAVEERPHPLGGLLILTDSGRETLASFTGRIPLSRRETVDQEAPAWRQRFQQAQQAPAEVFHLADGSPCLCLRLMQGSQPVMDILLPVADERDFTRLQQRWQRVAAEVYRGILMALSAGEEILSPLPGWAALAPAESGRHLLSLGTEGKQGMTLMLPAADEETAGRYAAVWAARGTEMRALVLGALEKAQG